MKIKAFLAGLSVAGKVALGAGVAAAATTGAGAAGVLPGPMQHAFSNAVGTVTPFGGSGDGGAQNAATGDGGEHQGGAGTDSTTTTTEHHEGGTTPTTGSETVTPTTVHQGDGEQSPPTTEHHDGDATTPTTEHHDGDGSHGGSGGDGDTTTTIAPVTTTTEHHDGDSNNPESLSLHCERGYEPAHVTCTWSASTNPAHAKYVLLRTGDGHGRVMFQSEDGLAYTDDDIAPGLEYGYRVISLRSDGSVESHSNLVTV